MSIHNEVRRALGASVKGAGQPETVAENLALWFQEIASGNESIDNRESVFRRLDGLCALIDAGTFEEDSE